MVAIGKVLSAAGRKVASGAKRAGSAGQAIRRNLPSRGLKPGRTTAGKEADRRIYAEYVKPEKPDRISQAFQKALGKEGEVAETKQQTANIEKQTAQIQKGNAQTPPQASNGGQPPAQPPSSGAAPGGSGGTSLTRLHIAMVLAIFYDLIDGVLTFFGVGELFEWILDIFMQLLLIFVLCKEYYKPRALVEFIPFIDVIPMYSLSVYGSIRQYKKDHGYDMKKELNSKPTFNKWGQGMKGLFGGVARGLGGLAGGITNRISVITQKKGFWKVALIILIIVGGILGAIGATDRGAAAFNEYVFDPVARFLQPERFQLFVATMWAKTLSTITKTRNAFDERIAIATGQQALFESEVDTARDLGVDVSFDRPQRTEFFLTDPYAYSYGTVQGKRLSAAVCDALDQTCATNEQVTITCRTQEGFVPINQQDRVIVPFEDIEGVSASVECRVPPPVNESKNTFKRVQIDALYPFRTAGYARVPFLHADVFRRLDQQGEFIETYRPQTTPGPVSIAFSQLSDPITLRGTDFTNTKAFGFEISNTGSGMLESIERVTFAIPQGVQLQTCNLPGFNPSSCSGNICVIENTGGENYLNLFKGIPSGGRKLFINCQAVLTPEVIDANAEITYDSFRVLVEYTYRAFDSLTIDFEEPEFAKEIGQGQQCDVDYGCECVSGGRKLYIQKGNTC